MASNSSVQTINEHEDGADEEEHRVLLNGTKYFRVKDKKDDGNFVATCMTCESKQLSKQDYSASQQSHSNLTKHLKTKHPDVHKDYLKEVIPCKRMKLNQSKFELINLEEKQEATDTNTPKLCYTKFLSPSIVCGTYENLVLDLNSQINVKKPDDLYLDIYKTVNDVKQDLKTVFEKTPILSLTATVMEVDAVVYLLIASFWINETDLSRGDALLSCKLAPSHLRPDNIRAAVKNVMTEYGIKKQQVPSVIINAIADHNGDFENFLADPKDLGTENYYVFPDEGPAHYPTVNLLQNNGNVNDIRLENSIVHQILKFAMEDFVTILKDKDLLHFHHEMFSKVNKIWNLADKNPDVFKSSVDQEVKGPSANISSLYECIHTIYCIQDKLNAIDTSFDIPEFTDTEIAYLREILKYLQLIKLAIQGIEYRKDAYYGHVAPTVKQLYDDLSDLDLTELFCIRNSLLAKYKQLFDCYLNVCNDNTAMFAACFYPGYKRDWLLLEDRKTAKDLCKKKVAERSPNGPVIKTTEITKPKRMGYIALRAHSTAREKDNADIEALTYFRHKIDSNDNLTALPTIRKLFIEYNTVISNPLLIKAVIDRSNVLKNLDYKLNDSYLFNCYAIINSAKSEKVSLENELEEQSEEGEEEEEEE